MQFYFKAQSQHGHSMLQLAVELARIRSFFGDAPYEDSHGKTAPQLHAMCHGCQTSEARHYAGQSQERGMYRQRASLPCVSEAIPHRAPGERDLR